MDRAEPSNSPIETQYRALTPGSMVRTERARDVFPSGIVHDSRRMWPYPLYVDRALGAHKWDVDGNEYVDYYGGHGALILGHGHPHVLAAVHEQLDRGTHFAACHDLEVAWGEQIQSMVPCAERVRFLSSGTEANLLALRIARAHTGRNVLVRFRGHFHGWQDHVSFGVDSHLDGTPTPGVLPGIAEQVVLADSTDVAGTVALLESRDDIAAVILEPTGGMFGALPSAPGLLAALREVTTRCGIVLIFDEVVTGFRVSAGGAQAYYGVTPDLASFAKIVSGGLPGGAVAGSKALLDHLDFEVSAALGREKISHQGTFNANPASAAAGVAALEIIAQNDLCASASSHAADIRDGVNTVFAEENVPWACYGEHSGFYFYTDPNGNGVDPQNFDVHAWAMADIKACASKSAVVKLRLALLANGVDISGKPGGIVSGVHSDDDVSRTLDATRAAVRALRAEGELA
jgi:glutamate-1-semialdehyde 2,1-aminomutase